MVEDWRSLEVTVPASLIRIADGTTQLFETVHAAHRKLAACANVLRILGRGGATSADDVREAPSARAFLGDARRELARLLELHDAASHVFDIYSTLLPLDLEDEPRWRRWDGHSGDTRRRAYQALRGLRSATSHLLASRNALLMARSCPHLSADWTAWMSAALHLARCAMWESTMAMASTRQMSDAVALELDDAWMIVFLIDSL